MSSKTRSKRKQQDLSSPPSPTNTQPSKIQSITRNMSNDSCSEIMKMITKLTEQQNSHFTSLKDSMATQGTQLKNELTQLINGIKEEFRSEIESTNKKIEAATETFSHKIDDTNNLVSSLEARVINVEKDYERLSGMNELKLIGIPISENENLSNIFTNLSKLIGYDTSNTINIPSMARIISRNKLTNEIVHTKIIIMKFIAVHMKETFFSLYLQLLPNKKITTKDLGYTVENRLIIGENLTQKNQEIFIEANKLKREQKIAQVFTINGIVNIKIQKGGSIHEIRSKQNLDLLLGCTSYVQPLHTQPAPKLTGIEKSYASNEAMDSEAISPQAQPQ